MKTVVYAAAGLLTTSFLVFSPAFAQSEGNQGQEPSSRSYEVGYQDGMRAAREKYAGEIIERIRDRSQNGEDEDANDENGAHFRLIRGNARLDVKCSPEDPTEKCVEAAIALMDHIGIERREAKAGTQPPGQENPPSPAGPQRQ